MASTHPPNNQDDRRRKSIRVASKKTRIKRSRIMMAIILAALQILLLLLKAHFNKDEDKEKALAHIQEAQEKLAEIAAEFESKIRYSGIPQENIDRLQDLMDKERKQNELHPDK